MLYAVRKTNETNKLGLIVVWLAQNAKTFGFHLCPDLRKLDNISASLKK